MAGGPEQCSICLEDLDGGEVALACGQEQAAHAVNAAIRRAGLEGRRHTNPVVDGQLVPKVLKAKGHGPRAGRRRKRRREEPAATATRARRPRRAVSFDEFQPDDEGGWD